MLKTKFISWIFTILLMFGCASSALCAETKITASSYTKAFAQEIQNRWDPPDRKTVYRITLNVRIEKDGSISSVTKSRSTADAKSDDYAMMLITGIRKFAPIPDDFPSKKINSEGWVNGEQLGYVNMKVTFYYPNLWVDCKALDRSH